MQNRITIAGESAGAVFCHALLVMGSPVDSCILQSGTLGLSPPQPRSVAESLINRLSDDLQAHGEKDLRSVPVPVLLAAQDRLGMHSFYLQEDESLQGWKNAPFCERLLIGDTEFEVGEGSREGKQDMVYMVQKSILTPSALPFRLFSGATGSNPVHQPSSATHSPSSGQKASA